MLALLIWSPLPVSSSIAQMEANYEPFTAQVIKQMGTNIHNVRGISRSRMLFCIFVCFCIFGFIFGGNQPPSQRTRGERRKPSIHHSTSHTNLSLFSSFFFFHFGFFVLALLFPWRHEVPIVMANKLWASVTKRESFLCGWCCAVS